MPERPAGPLREPTERKAGQLSYNPVEPLCWGVQPRRQERRTGGFMTAIDSSRLTIAISEDDVDSGVLPRLREVARCQPDKVAVTDAAQSLTYRQLTVRAATILSNLRQAVAGLNPPAVPRGADEFGAAEPVAILFGHEVDAVAALVAVIASGHPVLVLDPRTPAPRSQQLLARIGARIVLAAPELSALAYELSSRVVHPGGKDCDPELLWERPPHPASVAVVAFTSGSTGAPKPVANNHRLLVRDAWNSSVASGCYDTDDVIAHTLPIAFHAGLTTTVHGLLVGVTLHLYDTRSSGISTLGRFIAHRQCTIMIASPAILRAFCAAGPDPANLRSLRRLTVAGEPSHEGDVRPALAILPPGCVVRNRYGSSETGLISEYVVDEGTLSGQLPAGRGVGRTVLEPVDAVGQVVPQGEVGRLQVTAPEVATGYWGMPTETAEAFGRTAEGMPTYLTSDLGRMLPNGDVMIVGRADHSVKIRGYLVDPGEVDAVLFEIPGIREAVTTSGQRPSDHGTRLIAYVVAESGVVDEAAVRSALRGRLPGHMVPEVIVALDALPRNDRGKVDRAALPAPTEPEDAAALHLETGWECLVAEHWGMVLCLDPTRLRRNSDFFALGGDSLAAEEVMTRLVDHCGVPAARAETRLLVEAPTLGEFAQRIREATPKQPRRWSLPLQEAGDRTPLFLVTGAGGLGVGFLALARRLGADQPSYALQSPLVEARGLPEWSVPSMARRRVRQLRRIQPHGPYALGGHSFGGVVAVEMAHQLQAAGEEVSHLVILDSFPPDPAYLPELEHWNLRQQARFVAGTVFLAATSRQGSMAWRLFHLSNLIAPRHRGRPWSGKTLVVVADSPERSLRAAWAAYLTGPWRRVDVTGDHITMLRSPWVDEVARHIQEFLGEPA